MGKFVKFIQSCPEDDFMVELRGTPAGWYYRRKWHESTVLLNVASVFWKKGGVWVETMDPKKWTFFPPLTLVLCDSGRDNQLRVKSPPMIVIINLKTQTKQTKNNKFRGDDETHHGTVERTDAKWQMPDRMHMNAASQGGYIGADLCVH